MRLPINDPAAAPTELSPSQPPAPRLAGPDKRTLDQVALTNLSLARLKNRNKVSIKLLIRFHAAE